jgi:hypothetical protein
MSRRRPSRPRRRSRRSAAVQRWLDEAPAEALTDIVREGFVELNRFLSVERAREQPSTATPDGRSEHE